jgi:type II secretory pathway pseudopilin PulG
MPVTNSPIRLRKNRLQAAFSLVEVSVAAAVLMITSVGVFSSLTKMQQSAISNRALTNSDNILRSVIDQALSRGWDNDAAPLDILQPTIPGNVSPYFAGSDVTNIRWKQWDYYRSEDASGTNPDPTIPIYEEVNDLTKSVPARLYRKSQYVAGTGTQKLLWITFRIEYTLRGQLVGHEAWVTRAAD